jgi:hypothetical protein
MSRYASSVYITRTRETAVILRARSDDNSDGEQHQTTDPRSSEPIWGPRAGRIHLYPQQPLHVHVIR